MKPKRDMEASRDLMRQNQALLNIIKHSQVKIENIRRLVVDNDPNKATFQVAMTTLRISNPIEQLQRDIQEMLDEIEGEGS